MPDHCSDCLKGVLHEGEPAGTTRTIGGVETYVTLPSGEYARDAAVLILGDIYGQYTNAKLVSDSFAQAGFATYFPDYLFGDPVSLEEMKRGGFSLDDWKIKGNHTPVYLRKALDNVIEALKKEGITKFASYGLCLGGKYAVDLAIDNAVTVSAAAHPAGVAVPADLDSLLAKSTVPLLIKACETDRTWPKESQDKAAASLVSYTPGFKQNYYAGATHGFSVRADLNVPTEKAAKEESFKETVAWFKKYLV